MLRSPVQSNTIKRSSQHNDSSHHELHPSTICEHINRDIITTQHYISPANAIACLVFILVVATVEVVVPHAVAVLIVGDILVAVSLSGAADEVVAVIIVVATALVAVILVVAAVITVNIRFFSVILIYDAA